jgi:uncharacterized membrane protein YebE (DUF533 family)
MIEKLVPLGTGALAAGLAARLFGSKRLRDVSGTALQVGAVAAIGRPCTFFAFPDSNHGCAFTAAMARTMAIISFILLPQFKI